MRLELLRDNPPLKRYVSRGDTRDNIDIAGPHEVVDQAVLRCIRMTIQDGTPRFQPILGSAGMGKTHLFWVLKDMEKDSKRGPFCTVYVPSPPAPVRVPLHFYSCLVDETGDTLFDKASEMLLRRFGQDVSESGQIQSIMNRALINYSGISSDVVKVLLQYRLTEDRRELARRWLLGDTLNASDLERLDVRTILEEDDVTLATFRLLTESSEMPIVVFVDEMEGPFNTHGEEGERRFMEVLKRLYNQCKNLVLVASCLSDIWPRISSLTDAPMRSRMEPPVSLRAFTREDIKSFFASCMRHYWEEQNLDPPADPIFPLTESDIDMAFERSRGTPREAIRWLINRLDSILLGRIQTAVVPQDDHVIKLTSSVVIGSIVKAILMVGLKSGVDVRLQTASGGGTRQASAIVQLRKNGISKTVCIDVPSIKDWDRSGGVAAFYSAQRIKTSIDERLCELGIVALPDSTKGAKFESLSEELGPRLITLRFNAQTATRLVYSTNQMRLDDEERTMFVDLLSRIFSNDAH